MGFTGWPAEAITFFEQLEIDNSKAFFDEHKAVYLSSVRAPMEALLADLQADFGAPKIFRPNRDVRFSHDKTPYKTNIAATLGSSGYISLSADELGVGGGMWRMATDQLERYRAAVDDAKKGAALEKIVAGLHAAGHDCGPHDALKTAPRGWSKDHPRIELLKAKGLTAWHGWPVGPWLRKPTAKDRVVDVLTAVRPLNAWLDKHVGPTTLQDDRR